MTANAPPFPEFAARCDEPRQTLWNHMAERGMRESDGWRIYEFTREVDGRTELAMRPIHAHLIPPPDLECVCKIEERSATTTSECST